MQLPTFDLLHESKGGNVRCDTKGKLHELRGPLPRPQGRRQVQRGILYDPDASNFDIDGWTVWSKDAPNSTKGYVNGREFRAHVASSQAGEPSIVSLIYPPSDSKPFRLAMRAATRACVMISGVVDDNRKIDCGLGSMHGGSLHLRQDGFVGPYAQKKTTGEEEEAWE